ncbi:MAG: hypothetical protein KA984_00300 [Candidatus Cloacimonetes bacterium]|nr:hypothetical protein [Candidatus Cloacimonadota bacterium]
MRSLLIGIICILIMLSTFMACSGNKEEKLTSDQQHIKNVVNLRSAQLKQIYDKHYTYKPQSGAVKIKLFITDAGTVQNADLVVDWGSFTPEFLSEVKNKLLTWEFIIKTPTVYSYKAAFGK